MIGSNDNTVVFKVAITGIKPGNEGDKELIAKVEGLVEKLLDASLKGQLDYKFTSRSCGSDSGSN